METALRIHAHVHERLVGGDAPEPYADFGTILRIAMAINACYEEKHGAGGPADAAELWAGMSDQMKCSNMCQALFYEDRVSVVGYSICHGRGVEGFSGFEIEKMAVIEHDRWILERQDNGWTFSEKKDNNLKTSPYLVPWSELPEDIRAIDREAVSDMIPILASADMGVARRN